jgi:hypothetical protein
VHRACAHSIIVTVVRNPASILQMNDLEPLHILQIDDETAFPRVPGTPKPGGVSPLSCRGVSSLYCAYMSASRNMHYGKFLQVFAKFLRLTFATSRAFPRSVLAIRPKKSRANTWRPAFTWRGRGTIYRKGLSPKSGDRPVENRSGIAGRAAVDSLPKKAAAL